MVEVRERQVEEVDDDEQLGEPVVGAYPHMHEPKEEEVGRNVVFTNVGGGGHIDDVCAPEGPGVDELEDEEDDPGGRLAGRLVAWAFCPISQAAGT